MQVRRRKRLFLDQRLLFLGLLAIGLLAGLEDLPARPDCDSQVTRQALADLVQGPHRVIEVRNILWVSDSMTARSCRATVRWEDGSSSKIPFRFEQPGRDGKNFTMWTDLAGQVRGPGV